MTDPVQHTTNRLAREKSPYLAQHAQNPVDWFPWGEEAFAKARREHKPVFLSVGYSTCHWCHVMAHESFEDVAIAHLLNRDYIAIKVDREERPDIDRLYMAYVQSVTRGGGGWPLSVWLTPELKPFYGGTYFPPEDSYGRPGFARVLASLAEAWRTARKQIEGASEESFRLLQASASALATPEPVDDSALRGAAAVFEADYDARNGGFGGAPKFPRPSVLAFLLRYHSRTGESLPLKSVLHTLKAMAEGGLHDHLGGGFHRYATDERWLVPHFEKMVYDQAQLVCAYLDAYQLTGDETFADVARDTLEYVRNDLSGPDGGFYSAEDADSPVFGTPEKSAEGAFYTWTESEIRAVLGEQEGRRFGAAFGLDRMDNVVDGRHVLAVSCEEEARALLARHRAALSAARNKRPRPACDDKVVTAWNGLMISAFARAYPVLGNPADRVAAERAAAFVRHHLYDPATGRLRRRCRDGEAALNAYAEDYAFLIQGLLDLYEADFNPAHLAWAFALQDKQDELFLDTVNGGYFSSAADAPDVPIRMKERSDGAEPSANSVAALNLLRCGAITGLAGYLYTADQVFAAFSRQLREVPASVPQLLASLTFRLGEIRQIVVAGDRDASDTRALLRTAQRPFAPTQVVLLADGNKGQTYLAQFQPALHAMSKQGGHAAAYVCTAFACQEPTTDTVVLSRLLQR